jgi:hypothetical protein
MIKTAENIHNIKSFLINFLKSVFIYHKYNNQRLVIGGVYFITINLSIKLCHFNFFSIFLIIEKSFFKTLFLKNFQNK